jgi:glycosyltransferase involved in cell wall biosynthesis
VHAIVANGFAEGPAQALRDYLLARHVDVVTIFHPLSPEQGTRHVVTRYLAGKPVEERTRRTPLTPPLSFVVDPFVPLLPPRVHTWFGFNPLACARGLAARHQGRARSAVLWSVDFVPDRFGAGTIPTRIYDRLDKLCCLRADARVELSTAAREARNLRHGLAPRSTADTHVVPMGAWLDRVVTTQPDGYGPRRAVFLGHLVARQGVETFLEALALLETRAAGVTADIVGTGPLEQALRARAKTLGLEHAVTFHGFVADHRSVEQLLAASSVGVAPYDPGGETFTRYADPGKLKAYLAAGLPIVLTDVPPNAEALARRAGAELVPYDAGSLATAIAKAVDSPERWRERRAAALEHARQFDWNVLLEDLFRKLKLEPPVREPAETP